MSAPYAELENEPFERAVGTVKNISSSRSLTAQLWVEF